MIELNYGNDTSVKVSSGKNSFGIAFCEVPRASDNAERRYHRVHTPLTDPDGSKGSSLHAFPFTIYNRSAKRNNIESGSHYLAIEDDKAFAIRLFSGNSPDMESAFKVKVRIGGVNVLQHTTDEGKQSQDYFVVSEQKWVWGKQVDETTARQFRVFGHARESLSARSQLVGDNLVKEVEIEISSREERPRTPDMIPHYRPRSRSVNDESPSRSRSESPATLVQSDTDISILSNSNTPSTRPTTRQGSTPTLDQNTLVSFSSSSSQGGCSCNKDGSDLESIHSTPEEGAATSRHQMVIGTGGLIRQIVEKDQHPEDWTDRAVESVTLRFKIFDPNFFEEATNIPLDKGPGGNYQEVPNPPHRCFKGHRPIVPDPDGLRKDLLSPMELEGVGEGVVEDDMNAFLSLWGEARSQPRPLLASGPGVVMEKEATELESEPEPKREREREPKPVLQRPSPFPLPGSQPEKQKHNNNSNDRTEPRLGGTIPRSTPTAGRCTTGLMTRKESTKRWKSKWRKFITAMRRLLSPGQWAAAPA